MNRKTNQKRSNFQRIKLGVIKGFTTPTLPKHLLELERKPLIRIFRVLGGLTTLIVIKTKLQFLGDGNFFFIAMIISGILIFSLAIYLFYMSIHRIRHIYKLIKSGEADVYNSPLDKYASIFSRILLCAKGVCDTAAPVGVLFGGMTAIDSIRQAGGRDPIFLTGLAKLFFGNDEVMKQVQESKKIQEEIVNKSRLAKELKDEAYFITKLEELKFFTPEEAKSLREGLQNNANILESDCKGLAEKIHNQIAELESKRKK